MPESIKHSFIQRGTRIDPCAGARAEQNDRVFTELCAYRPFQDLVRQEGIDPTEIRSMTAERMRGALILNVYGRDQSASFTLTEQAGQIYEAAQFFMGEIDEPPLLQRGRGREVEREPLDREDRLERLFRISQETQVRMAEEHRKSIEALSQALGVRHHEGRGPGPTIRPEVPAVAAEPSAEMRAWMDQQERAGKAAAQEIGRLSRIFEEQSQILRTELRRIQTVVEEGMGAFEQLQRIVQEELAARAPLTNDRIVNIERQMQEFERTLEQMQAAVREIPRTQDEGTARAAAPGPDPQIAALHAEVEHMRRVLQERPQELTPFTEKFNEIERQITALFDVYRDLTDRVDRIEQQAAERERIQLSEDRVRRTPINRTPSPPRRPAPLEHTDTATRMDTAAETLVARSEEIRNHLIELAHDETKRNVLKRAFYHVHIEEITVARDRTTTVRFKSGDNPFARILEGDTAVIKGAPSNEYRSIPFAFCRAVVNQSILAPFNDVSLPQTLESRIFHDLVTTPPNIDFWIQHREKKSLDIMRNLKTNYRQLYDFIGALSLCDAEAIGEMLSNTPSLFRQVALYRLLLEEYHRRFSEIAGNRRPDIVANDRTLLDRYRANMETIMATLREILEPFSPVSQELSF